MPELPLPRTNVCDWCETPITDRDRPVRLSNTQPPWTLRAGASVISGVALGFSSMNRALSDTEEITLWFHRPCWDKFVNLLRGGRE